MATVSCKKCPYFDAKAKMPLKIPQLIGFCKLREKFVDEITVGQQFCKDRAVLNAPLNFNNK